MGISPLLNSQLFLRILRFSNPQIEKNEQAETLLIETNDKGGGSEKSYVWVRMSGGNLDVKPSSASVDSSYTKFDLSDGLSSDEMRALGVSPQIIKAFAAVARGLTLEGQPIAAVNNPQNIDDPDLDALWPAISSLSIANRWTTEQSLFALLTLFSDPGMTPAHRNHKARDARFTAIEDQIANMAVAAQVTNVEEFIATIKGILGISEANNPILINLRKYITTQKLDVTKEADRKQTIRHISAMAAATSWPVDFQKKYLGFVAPFTPDKKAQYDEPSFNLDKVKAWAGQLEHTALAPPIAPPVVPPPPPVMGPPAPTEKQRAYVDALVILQDEAIKDLGQPKNFDELAKALAKKGCDGYRTKLEASNPKPEDLISAAKHYREFFVYEPKADRQLSVNTTERHYFIEGLSREEGETQLQKRVDGAMVEEGWIYVEYTDASGVSHKRWYETGTEQDLAAVYVKTHIIEKLLAQKSQISHVGHYHIHPGYASEMAKRSNKTALNMPSEGDFSTFEFTALRVKSNGYSGPVNFNVITSDGRFTVNFKMDDPKFKNGFAKTIAYAREAILQAMIGGKTTPQPDPSVRERKLTNEGVDVKFTLSPVRFSPLVFDIMDFFIPDDSFQLNSVRWAEYIESSFASLGEGRAEFEGFFAKFIEAFKKVAPSLQAVEYEGLFKAVETFLFVNKRHRMDIAPKILGEAYGRYLLINKEICDVFKPSGEKFKDNPAKFNEANSNHEDVFHSETRFPTTIFSIFVPLLPHILDYFSKEKAAATKAALVAISIDPQKGKKLSDAVKTQNVPALKTLLDAEINPKPAAPVPSPAPSLDEVISIALLRLAESDPKLIAFMARVPEGQREALRYWMLAERCVEFKPSEKISGDKDAAKRHFSQALEGKDLNAPEWKWMQKATERLLKIKHSEHTSRINLAKRTGYSEQVLARFEELTDASVNATVFKSGDNEYFQVLDIGFQVFGLRKVIKSPKGQDVRFFVTFGSEASLDTINESIRATKQRLMEIGDAYKTLQERGFGYHVELHEENFRTYLTYDNSLLSSFRTKLGIIPTAQIIIDGNNFHIKFPLSENVSILTKPFPLSSATSADVDAEIERIINESNRPAPAAPAPVAPVEEALGALGALDPNAPPRPSHALPARPAEPPRSAPPAPVPPPAGPAIVPSDINQTKIATARKVASDGNYVGALVELRKITDAMPDQEVASLIIALETAIKAKKLENEGNISGALVEYKKLSTPDQKWLKLDNKIKELEAKQAEAARKAEEARVAAEKGREIVAQRQATAKILLDVLEQNPDAGGFGIQPLIGELKRAVENPAISEDVFNQAVLAVAKQFARNALGSYTSNSNPKEAIEKAIAELRKIPSGAMNANTMEVLSLLGQAIGYFNAATPQSNPILKGLLLYIKSAFQDYCSDRAEALFLIKKYTAIIQLISEAEAPATPEEKFAKYSALQSDPQYSGSLPSREFQARFGKLQTEVEARKRFKIDVDRAVADRTLECARLKGTSEPALIAIAGEYEALPLTIDEYFRPGTDIVTKLKTMKEKASSALSAYQDKQRAAAEMLASARDLLAQAKVLINKKAKNAAAIQAKMKVLQLQIDRKESIEKAFTELKKEADKAKTALGISTTDGIFLMPNDTTEIIATAKHKAGEAIKDVMSRAPFAGIRGVVKILLKLRIQSNGLVKVEIEFASKDTKHVGLIRELNQRSAGIEYHAFHMDQDEIKEQQDSLEKTSQGALTVGAIKGAISWNFSKQFAEVWRRWQTVFVDTYGVTMAATEDKKEDKKSLVIQSNADAIIERAIKDPREKETLKSLLKSIKGIEITL